MWGRDKNWDENYQWEKNYSQGVKPIGIEQWKYNATYLYGFIEPLTGEYFFWEFSHLNTDCFQVFLNLIAEKYPEYFLIIQLDNGAFHKAKRLQVPDNVILMFQPPHCPELNPIEQIWQYFKRRLRWLLPTSLDELRQHLFSIIKQLTHQTVASIAGRLYIKAALSVVSF